MPLVVVAVSLVLKAFAVVFLIIVAAVEGKYPNEIIDTPIVSCEQDRVVIKIRTSTANPSHIYAEDFYETQKCMVRNQNKIVFPHGECGMTTEHMENPAGTMYRICLSVQIHPLFITDSDRSYCAQCVYMEANIVDDLEQKLAISEMTPNELDPQFDEASTPHCTYSIRKGSIDGPEVHAAVVGESVFHVWQCTNENIGILVQNCHVEDLQGDKILIIDQNGCGVDQYLFKTPQYSVDFQTAHLQSNVFKFVDKSMTRFRCQLRLCVKNRGRGCESITPPSGCPSIEADVAVFRTTPSAAGSYASDEQAQQQSSQQQRQRVSSQVSTLANRKYVSPSPPPTYQTSKAPSQANTVGGGSNRGGPPAVGPSYGRPPGTLLNGGSPPSPQVSLTVGPPSIRPVFSSLSTAHIISGKTSSDTTEQFSTPFPATQATGSKNATGAGGYGAVSAHTSPYFSGVGRLSQLALPSAGGYPYRSRRSVITKVVNKTSAVASDPQLAKRYAADNNNDDDAENNYKNATTSGRRQDEEGIMQEQLDVVGLIRVVDNPDDLEFFMNENHAGRQVITVSAQQKASQALPLIPSAGILPSIPLVNNNENDKESEIASYDTMDLEQSQKCVSPPIYWLLLFGFVSLFFLQFTAIAIVVVDRLIFDKQISKKVNRYFNKY